MKFMELTSYHLQDLECRKVFGELLLYSCILNLLMLSNFILKSSEFAFFSETVSWANDVKYDIILERSLEFGCPNILLSSLLLLPTLMSFKLRLEELKLRKAWDFSSFLLVTNTGLLWQSHRTLSIRWRRVLAITVGLINFKVASRFLDIVLPFIFRYCTKWKVKCLKWGILMR